MTHHFRRGVHTIFRIQSGNTLDALDDINYVSFRGHISQAIPPKRQTTTFIQLINALKIHVHAQTSLQGFGACDDKGY